MAKQQLLSNMFTIIDKEEMEDRVERDFAQLHVKMELEQSKKKEVQKRPVGRPKMRIEAVLLPTGGCKKDLLICVAFWQVLRSWGAVL